VLYVLQGLWRIKADDPEANRDTNMVMTEHIKSGPSKPDSDPDLEQIKYYSLEVAKTKGYRALLSIPAEDGLILVPVVLAGVTPWRCILGGLIFGLLHYPGLPAIACFARAVAYSLIMYVFLPQGLFSIVVGHLIVDLMVIYFAKQHLKDTNEKNMIGNA